MATIYYKIFKHHKKTDGNYNVKYCVTHKGKQVYISSPYNVSEKQMFRTTMKLRDDKVLKKVLDEMDGLRQKMEGLGVGIDGMTAQEILQHITKNVKPDQIDFIKFCRSYIDNLKFKGKHGTARSLSPVVNNLVDFFGSESVPVERITSRMLRSFEEYLSQPRKLVRTNWTGDDMVINRPAVSRSGLHATMRDLRVLFNQCRREHNTEMHTAITHYPFDYYKLPPPGTPKKKGGDLSVDSVKAIQGMEARAGSRKELARDMFMLSFYLCGMNAKDIYGREWRVEGGRATYGRSKTRDRRGDGAVISVLVPGEAAEILNKYSVLYLRNRYSGYDTFLTAIDKGMEQVSESLGIKTTFYHARHTFATLAHNVCGFNESEIAEALNHVDQSRKVTKRYIQSDWSVVDRVQKGVLRLLK